MAAATVSFTPDTEIPGTIQSLGSLQALVGTLTFAGDYEVGGIAIDVDALFAQTGLGKVYAVIGTRGYQFEYDETNGKIIVWSSAGTEHAAATLDTDLTGSPMPVVILGR